MSIKMNIGGNFVGKEKEIPDGINFETQGETVGDCLDQYLATKPNLKIDFFNKSGALDKDIYVFVNAQAVISDHLQKEVKDGDQVKIMYAQMHGC